MLREVAPVSWCLWFEQTVKIKHAKQISEVFNEDRVLETVYCHDFLPHGTRHLQLKQFSR
jgi:hypothetical protein